MITLKPFLLLFLIAACTLSFGQNLPTSLPLNLIDTNPKTPFNYFDATSTISAQSLLEHLAFLSSDELEGRKTGEPGNLIARNHIINELLSQGLEVTLQPFSFERRGTTYDAVNIITAIKGSENPDKYIAITAHYDHVGIGKAVDNDSIYNGADDNASGVAAMLAMTKFFKENPPKNSLLFIALDAEELGLQGAKYFVENKGDKNILLNINMDMISRNKNNEIYICGTRYTPSLAEYFNGIPESTFPVKFTLGHDGLDGKDDWSTQSDHFHFYRNNIPFLYFGVEDHSGYHKPSDEFQFIHPDFYYQVVKFITNSIADLDSKIE
ncbi:MAG: M28 family peptidase [Flavobacteriaceae bacterium]|nr:M28 family peptidase [Flavobacteriaceae bacterium]